MPPGSAALTTSLALLLRFLLVFVFVAGQKEMDFVPLPSNVEPVSANNQTHSRHFKISHN